MKNKNRLGFTPVRNRSSLKKNTTYYTKIKNTRNLLLKNKFLTGFTLIELLVVIAIIGILAGVVTIALSNARAKGRDSKRVGDVKQIVTSLEQYYIQYGAYPTGTGSIVPGGIRLSDPTAIDTSLSQMVPSYLPFIPVAPNPPDGDCLNTNAISSNNYWYEAVEDGSTYTLSFCLGEDNEVWKKGPRTASPQGTQ